MPWFSVSCTTARTSGQIPQRKIRKLQAVQNYACRIVSGARKYDHVTSHLKSLSRLPVKDQLYYRQATMAFKCISGHAPKYLTSQFITREQVTKRTTAPWNISVPQTTSCWVGIFWFWAPAVNCTGKIEPVWLLIISREKIADLKPIFVALGFMTFIDAIAGLTLNK